MRKIVCVEGENPVMLFEQEDLEGLIDCICNRDIYTVMAKTIADLNITDDIERSALTEKVVDNLNLFLNFYLINFRIEFENFETSEQRFDEDAERIKEIKKTGGFKF